MRTVKRVYVGSALDAQDELAAVQRRQSMSIVQLAPRDKIKRDVRLMVSAICGIVVSAGFVAALVWAVVGSR